MVTIAASSHFKYLPGSFFCRFSIATVPATLDHPANILCASPPWQLASASTSVSVDVSITTNGVDYVAVPSATQRLQYTYTDELRVLSLRPTAGDVNGGTLVLVHAANLLNSTKLLCRFGAAGVVQATFFSSQSAGCVSPPHDHGASEVCPPLHRSEPNPCDIFLTDMARWRIPSVLAAGSGTERQWFRLFFVRPALLV